MENAESSTRAYLVGTDSDRLREVRGVEGFLTSAVWSTDSECVLGQPLGDHAPVWKANADGTGAKRVLEDGCVLGDMSHDGRYLLCFSPLGSAYGDSPVSLADNRRTMLLPGVETFGSKFAPDGKSFVYAVARRGRSCFTVKAGVMVTWTAPHTWRSSFHSRSRSSTKGTRSTFTDFSTMCTRDRTGRPISI